MPVVKIDAPTRGINAFDSPEDMHPADAIALDNWLPFSGYLEARPPIDVHANITGDELPLTIINYRASDGSEQLIAHTPGTDQWHDFTTSQSTFSGTYGGDSSTRWQHTHINGILVLVCGQDNELAFNGTTFTDLDYTGSSPSITPGEFINVENFKGRAMYIKEDVCSFWYAAAGSYQGALTEFPLDSVARLGGRPVVIKTWTMDTGTGPDDTFVIVMDSGEVLLYQGDDPGDPDNWEIVGSYRMPAPTGYRAALSYGDDILIMTRDGIVNMKSVLTDDQRTDPPQFSKRIWPLIQDWAELTPAQSPTGEPYINGDGNCGVVWRRGFIMFSVVRDARAYDPYMIAMNTSTGAWTRLSSSLGGGNVWIQPTEFNGSIYFGGIRQGGTGILKLSTEGYDNTTETIALSAIPAFTDLGQPDYKKHVTAVQFYTNHPDPALIEVTGYSDFNLEGSLTAPTAYSGGGAPSESGVGTFPNVRRAMAHTTTKGWQNLHAYGFSISMAVQMATNDRTLYWRQSTLRYRKGGGN